MRRRDFVRSLTFTVGAAAVAGCRRMCPRDIVIGTNHGHTMDLPDWHIRSGKERRYDITGTGVHPHVVTLTEADYATLRGGGVVHKLSTADGLHGEIIGSAHTHTVMITANCPMAAT